MSDRIVVKATEYPDWVGDGQAKRFPLDEVAYGRLVQPRKAWRSWSPARTLAERITRRLMRRKPRLMTEEERERLLAEYKADIEAHAETWRPPETAESDPLLVPVGEDGTFQ